MEKIKTFLHGVKKEIGRVRWPNKKNMIKYSTAVFTVCLFCGIFFYIINLVVILVKGGLK
ncbi:MAG: preprotein translocase subunit SecE [Bacilli bacterium]|nr:preprotein translocase subunit SecE [Bacilli bacterium]MDD4298016.1 preprotein translocase subunit SecE [Bacilli bacterium]MDD4644107.1 preprotein translocase subunit SecE [Bacilli bacterium]